VLTLLCAFPLGIGERSLCSLKFIFKLALFALKLHNAFLGALESRLKVFKLAYVLVLKLFGISSSTGCAG
jgi:hypothetical protein